MTQTAPALPAAPKGTPAWLIRLASLLLVVAGPALAVWNPGGKLNSGAVQAAIIIAFLLVAFILFSIHVVLGAVHEYGWTKKAAADVESSELAELRSIFPEFKAAYTAAQPALATLPQFATLTERIGEIEHQVAQKAAAVDLPTVVDQVKTALAAQAAGIAPAAPVDPAAAPTV